MLTQVIWWFGILVESVILFRGLRGRLRSEYPVFYLYVSLVATVEMARFFTFRWHGGLYPQVYWDTQFLGVFIGCGIIFEIYRVGLRAFPGTARMARNLLLFVFAMVFAKAIVMSADGASWWSALTAMKLERDLRIVQVSALLALIVLFVLYAIPLGKNLKGVLCGYGLFLATSVLQLTVMVQLGKPFQGAWGYLRSGAYLLVLVVWLFSLWSYQEAPKAARAITLDEDYQALVASTRRRFRRTRLALAKVVRP